MLDNLFTERLRLWVLAGSACCAEAGVSGVLRLKCSAGSPTCRQSCLVEGESKLTDLASTGPKSWHPHRLGTMHCSPEAQSVTEIGSSSTRTFCDDALVSAPSLPLHLSIIAPGFQFSCRLLASCQVRTGPAAETHVFSLAVSDVITTRPQNPDLGLFIPMRRGKPLPRMRLT